MYPSSAVEHSVEELVERHGTLVKRIAHHLLARLPADVQLEDLLQAGIIGLIEASRNYDAGKGASFETFAGIRIRGAMIDEVRKGDWSPRSVHRNARRVAGAIRDVENRTGADASDHQVAAELGVSLDEYHAMLQDSAGSRLFSLEELVGGESDDAIELDGSAENPETISARERLARDIAGEIERLPERERLVLSLYYDEELNLKEIGLVLEVSESRVSQILSQATKRIRARLQHSYAIEADRQA
jgi:RNA polymerase sigma factor for flagellar operon FliA